MPPIWLAEDFHARLWVIQNEERKGGMGMLTWDDRPSVADQEIQSGNSIRAERDPVVPRYPFESVPHEIRINSAFNGYVCNVGCKIIVFETLERMLQELKRYLENPVAVELEYRKKMKLSN